MRPTLLVATVTLTSTLTAAFGPSVTTARAPQGEAVQGDAVQAPYDQIADELDLTTLVPALQDRFGDRYGGYWIEVRGTDDIMHVGVVAATDADRRAVSGLAHENERVVTDPVAHGYDELAAAHEAVAASLDPAAGHFSVETDLAGNRLVVRTAGDVDATARTARAAARRGAAQGAARGTVSRGGELGAPARPVGSAVPASEAASAGASPAPPATRTPVAPTALVPSTGRPDADIADAVTVVAAPASPVELLGRSRQDFPPYEAGLEAVLPSGSSSLRCTTAYTFANGYGLFGSTAGHCDVGNGQVEIGDDRVDRIRQNTYRPDRLVRADVALFSLSVGGWPSSPVVHGDGGTHRPVAGKLGNAAIGTGLRLCFEGVTSGSGSCGTVIRSHETICCDADGHSFVFTCIDHAARSGDSGGPVFYPLPDGRVLAAGMLSSGSVLDGSEAMCFSTVENIETRTGSTLVVGSGP